MGPLLRIYGGTLTLADRLIISNFFLYEQQRGASAGSFLVKWTGSPGGAPSSRPSQALASLDAASVFRSAVPASTVDLLQFEKDNIGVESSVASVLYDPIFVAQLFGQCLLDAGAYSALEWVELFRSNAVSVVVCMLSYREAVLRLLGFSILGNLWLALKVTICLYRGSTMLTHRRTLRSRNATRRYTSSTCSGTSCHHLPRAQPVRLHHHDCQCTRHFCSRTPSAVSFTHRRRFTPLPHASFCNALRSTFVTYLCCMACCTAHQSTVDGAKSRLGSCASSPTALLASLSGAFSAAATLGISLRPSSARQPIQRCAGVSFRSA